MKYIALALITLAACSDRTTEPKPPQTIEAAARAFDAAITALNWAQYDLHAAGGRDIVVSVQIDSALPPHYFRLPRK